MCLHDFRPKMKRISLIAGTAAILLTFGCNREPSQVSISAGIPDRIDFNFHVKPILSDRCYKCHGPDEKARKVELRLDVKESAFAIRDSIEERFAIVPGDLKKSQLVHRISSTDPDYMMPPPESNLSLSDGEIEILKRWIKQGAEWKPHWSFIPPERPNLPEVKDRTWPNNPIDYFILARQEGAGLGPSDEAGKTRLIRRVTLDLTGLPPTLEEIDEFLTDDSPKAYENMVDRVLTNPAYGERMAVPWLDLARYADTHGYQDDYDRSMWRWRDWVIEAFNQNLPFDQFTTWQLAGDLLPDPTYDQKLATGFNRNHMITQEGGVVPEEYRVEYVADRTQTTATAFLGLTMQCSRCHDHKFDPILQKEFYQLFSFFNNVNEKGLDGNRYTPAPYLEIPVEEVESVSNFLQNKISRLQEDQAQLKELRRTGFKPPKTKNDRSIPGVQSPTRGLIGYYNLDYFEKDKVPNLISSSRPGVLKNNVVEAKGKFSGGVEFTGQDHIDLGNMGDFEWNDPFSYSFWFKSHTRANVAPIFEKWDYTEDNTRGYQIVEERNWMAVRFGGEPGVRVRTLANYPLDKWFHMAVTYNGSGKASGIKMYFEGESEPLRIYKDELKAGNLRTGLPLLVGKSLRTTQERLATYLDDVRIFNRVLSPEEITTLANHDPLNVIMAKSMQAQGEKESLFHQYLHHQDSAYQAVVQEISHQKRAERHQRRQLQPTMIMEEMDTLRPAYVLRRGVYDAHGERVYPGTPARIMEFPTGLPANRLGLAQWLLDPQNPLTARVIVNRYWQIMFGEGIVGTVDDFGSQGALPSHPELLDWLAVEFVESGWDIKHMLRLMLTSATYRQSSKSSSEVLEKDPQNVLFARAPQYRLSAETIRDNVLAISGLLVPHIGGPSVHPYQPAGLWQEASSGRGTYRYTQGKGEELYRKSLYTFWKRTVPPPSMITFDAATRNYCVVKRQTTSTPLQALVLLNDPQVTEASRAFAERMITEGGNSPKSRIQFGFRNATSRYPQDKELEALTEILEFEQATFADDPGAALALLSVGERSIAKDYKNSELAAYSVVASALFNLDETITKY